MEKPFQSSFSSHPQSFPFLTGNIHPGLTSNPTLPDRREKIQGLVLLFFASVLTILILSYLKKVHLRSIEFLRKLWHVEKLNGPRAYPVIGNAPHMMFDDYFEWTKTLCKRWGDPVRLWKLHHPLIFVSTYKIANQMLSNSNLNSKMKDLEMIRRLPGGKGLSTNPHDIFASRRKLLQPGFSKRTVENSVYIFSEESIKLVKKLEIYAKSGESFNLEEFAMTCAFHSVSRCCFGETFMRNTSDTEAVEHMNALHTFGVNFSNRVLSPNLLKRNDWIYYNLTEDGRETKKTLVFINSFARKAINHKREERRSKAQNKNRKHSNYIASNGNDMILLEDIKDTGSQEEKNQNELVSYLDLLLDLEEQGKFTDEDIIGELNNFFVGVYDGVALTVMWLLFTLSLNPSHQEKVAEEIDNVLNENHGPIQDVNVTATDVKDFKFLDLCVKESLRLYPTAPVFPRSTHGDVKLDDGRIIPAGCDVLILANLINREEEYFPQPDKFIPERHLKSIKQFMPFSIGPRNCIGQIHAMYMTKVIAAYLLKEFKWETMEESENVKCNFQAFMYPANGLSFKISKRT